MTQNTEEHKATAPADQRGRVDRWGEVSKYLDRLTPDQLRAIAVLLKSDAMPDGN